MSPTPGTTTLRRRRRGADPATLAAGLGPVPGLPGDGAPVVLAHDPARDLTYTWYDRSPDPQDAGPRADGYETSLLLVTCRGHRVGHLRISFTTPELLAQIYPRPLAWAEDHRGWQVGYWAHARGYAQAPTPAEVWLAAHRSAERVPASLADAENPPAPWALRPEHVPDEATLEADLAALEVPLAAQMRDWLAWLQVPFVAYAHVDGDADEDGPYPVGHPGPLRGTGVGTRMYVLAARQLARTGRVLSASDSQTPAAQALWARLAADPDLPTTTVVKTGTRSGTHRSFPALDYTAVADA